MPYVNRYHHSLEWGGPEEGGWWWDHFTPIGTTWVDDDDHVTLDKVFHHYEDEAREHNSTRHKPSSVLADGRWMHVTIEPNPAEEYPTERPRYE